MKCRKSGRGRGNWCSRSNRRDILKIVFSKYNYVPVMIAIKKESDLVRKLGLRRRRTLVDHSYCRYKLGNGRNFSIKCEILT